MELGIYQMSNAEYHASEGISRSAISELQKSPLHYWIKYLAPERENKSPTREMILGSAVHTLVLEPHLFETSFAISQKFDGRTNAGKAAKVDFEKNSNGKLIISEDDVELAHKMKKAIQDHYLASNLLHEASVEQSLFWIDKESGLICKARPDAWHQSMHVICDIKTCLDSTRDAFIYAMHDGNYHIQAAMQIDAVLATTGKLITDFFFIAAQKSPPYKPYIYRAEEDVIEYGRKEYKAALMILKACIEEDNWGKDRNHVLPVFFKEYQKQSTFYKLQEIYKCPL